MKRLLLLFLLLGCCAIPIQAQTRQTRKPAQKHAQKKKKRVKKAAAPVLLVPVKPEVTLQNDLLKATRPAPAALEITPEIQKNTNYYQSLQSTKDLKDASSSLLQRNIEKSDQALLEYRGLAEAVPLNFIDNSELIPTRRILNGPSQYDSRVEIRALDPTQDWVKKIIKNGYSIAVVVDRSRLRQVSKAFYQIDDSNTLGSTYQLCAGEAFRSQPIVGTGTAIVTGKRQMMTAGHVFAGPPGQYAVVFGFEITNKMGAYQTIYPADSVYFPVSVANQSPDLDIAVFNVDRDLKAPPLKWSAETKPPLNEPIYMIGFPYGLPKKVAANAEVITPDNDLNFFYTSLDAFQGNSGSPVFNLKTNDVIGILVSGNVDYHWNGSCNVSVDCSTPYCQGEKAVRIIAIKNLFNNGK